MYVLAVNAGKTRCNLIFKSANQLKEHRLKEKHHNKGKSSKKPERKKGAQLRMEDMLENTTKNVEVVNNEEEETSEECQICKYFCFRMCEAVKRGVENRKLLNIFLLVNTIF